MDRARAIFGHLASPSSSAMANQIAPQEMSSRFIDGEDDVVICSALRTPLCKARRGGFKDTPSENLLSAVLAGVLSDVGLDPTLVGDICIGNVLQPGSGATMARVAQFFSGIPEIVPLTTVSRQCSSGLQACINIAGSIKAGFYDIGLAGGVESMSMYSVGKDWEALVYNPKLNEVQKAQDCLIPMGITSENVAKRYNISREIQDKMAVASHDKAHRAQQNGWFDAEIVPVNTKVLDKEGKETTVKVSKDDGVRPGTTMEILARLKPAFTEDGASTAGNSSQLTDGAAAVLLARRSAARKYNLPVLGVLRGYSVVGVPPDVMGIGPAYAIPAVLKKAGLTIDDIDIYEINEAFASQAAYCVEKLGIPWEKLNPKGGAIALGHPLGCTGARQVATLLHELKRRGKRGYGVVSMCIGTGMGAAAVFEYPGH